MAPGKNRKLDEIIGQENWKYYLGGRARCLRVILMSTLMVDLDFLEVERLGNRPNVMGRSLVVIHLHLGQGFGQNLH